VVIAFTFCKQDGAAAALPPSQGVISNRVAGAVFSFCYRHHHTATYRYRLLPHHSPSYYHHLDLLTGAGGRGAAVVAAGQQNISLFSLYRLQPSLTVAFWRGRLRQTLVDYGGVFGAHCRTLV